MKKILALLMAVAMVSTVFAQTTTVKESVKSEGALLFNRGQFQPHKAEAAGYALTVPMIYKGALSFDGWYVTTGDDCVVDTMKVKYDLFMTMCQPCLDCFPCESLPLDETDENTPAEFATFGADAVASPITRWYLYIVKTDKKDVTAYKINLMQNHGAFFFTGAYKKPAWISYGDVQPERTITQVLTGKKNDFKFAYQDAAYDFAQPEEERWTLNKDAKKATAYIKSIASMSGDFTATWDLTEGKALVTGTTKLTRNASLTKAAILDTFATVITVTTTTTTIRPDQSTSGWEDCDETIVETDEDTEIDPAGICEEYIDSLAFDEELAEDIYKNKNFTLEDEAAFGAYFVDFLNL